MHKIVAIAITVILACSGLVTAGLLEKDYFISSVDDKLDMVVIAPEFFSDALGQLVEYKNSVGIKTFLKTTEEIYSEYSGRDHPEQIKYCIKYLIEEYSIKYVLLVGSAADVPGRYTHIYFDEPFDYPTPDEWIFTSDFYYADIYDDTGNFSSWDTNNNNLFAEYKWNGNTDDIDLTPDIFLGRLACVDTEQAEICIDKIIEYETKEIWGKEWFTNLVLIAGDGIPFDPEGIDESEYLQEHIIAIMDGFIPNCVWASNGGLNDAYNINEAIEDGAGFVFFNGHGRHDLWATYRHNRNTMLPPGCYRTSHIDQLTNNEKLPIVISDACYHLQYDYHPDCFGWSFVANPEGGAIAFIGGSDTDLAFAGSRIVETGIEKLDLKLCQLYQEGVSHLGELWGKSLIAYDPGDYYIVDLLTILQNHLFGDPSLQIAEMNSQPPLTPNPPDGELKGKIDVSYEFTTVTIDLNGDDIYYLFDFGDQTQQEWVGPFPTGEVCSMNHIWTEKGLYQVRVKAKDTTGLMSNWSEPLVVSMPKARFEIIQIMIRYVSCPRLSMMQTLNFLRGGMY